MLQAKIEGKKLVVEIDLETPTRSASGKTLVVASSRGNQTTNAIINGQPITIGLNAYIRP